VLAEPSEAEEAPDEPGPEATAPDPEPGASAAPPEPAMAEYVSVEVSAPAGARIEIDGRPIGEAPLSGIRVQAGRRRFVARLGDGSVMQRTVEIGAQRDSVVFY
jgi:hypothetical protein